MVEIFFCRFVRITFRTGRRVFFLIFLLFWQFADGCLVGVGDGGSWWLVVVVVVAMKWL